MPRPKIYDQELKRRLLDEAGRVVTKHGLDALTLRRIAADAGTSTSAIYALIGGRDELILELFVEAYRSFGAAQFAVVPTGDTAVDLHALAVAYRAWALEHVYLYQVMFGGVLGDLELTEEQRDSCLETLKPLQTVVSDGLASGALQGGTADELDPELLGSGAWPGFAGVDRERGTAGRLPCSDLRSRGDRIGPRLAARRRLICPGRAERRAGQYRGCHERDPDRAVLPQQPAPVRARAAQRRGDGDRHRRVRRERVRPRAAGRPELLLPGAVGGRTSTPCARPSPGPSPRCGWTGWSRPSRRTSCPSPRSERRPTSPAPRCAPRGCAGTSRR